MADHRWEFCKHCNEWTVICGTCGEWCCTGGIGKVDGKDCPDCPSAYVLHDAGMSREEIEKKRLLDTPSGEDRLDD